MTSLAARTANLAFRALIKRNELTREQAPRHFRRAMAPPPVSLPLPGGVTLQADQRVGGIPGDWLRTDNAGITLLYLHGGAFMAGKTQTYHPFCGKLAQLLNADVFLADYRLAPEHPFPAPLDDAFNAYRTLLDDGVATENLVVAGDSAGGSLTLATLLRARQEGLPQPRCAVGISAATDATCEASSIIRNRKSDSMLSPAMIRQASDIYRNGTDAHNILVSPSRADFDSLPPLMFTVSETECLRDDTYAAVDKARAAGIPVEVVARSGLPHVWPVFWPLLPEARQDVKRIAAFIWEQG